jgi:hypothetical protein
VLASVVRRPNPEAGIAAGTTGTKMPVVIAPVLMAVMTPPALVTVTPEPR